MCLLLRLLSLTRHDNQSSRVLKFIVVELTAVMLKVQRSKELIDAVSLPIDDENKTLPEHFIN